MGARNHKKNTELEVLPNGTPSPASAAKARSQRRANSNSPGPKPGHHVAKWVTIPGRRINRKNRT